MHCTAEFRLGKDWIVGCYLIPTAAYREDRSLELRGRGVSAAEGLMILQNQMLSAVYWHKTARSVIAMFHAVLAHTVGKDHNKLENLAKHLKNQRSEQDAMNRVILPMIDACRTGQDDKMSISEIRVALRRLVLMHVDAHYEDIFECVKEYRQFHRPPTQSSADVSIYDRIVSVPRVSGDAIPIDWEPVKTLKVDVTKMLLKHVAFLQATMMCLLMSLMASRLIE